MPISITIIRKKGSDFFSFFHRSCQPALSCLYTFYLEITTPCTTLKNIAIFATSHGIIQFTMNTRNTTNTHIHNRAERAMHLLETLQQPHCTGILRYLLDHGQASFLELTIHTGMDSESLEFQLERLCSSSLVRQRSSLLEADRFEPNLSKLRRVTAVVKQLAAFHKE